MPRKENKKDLEAALKEKVEPLLEQTMERHLGITIPKIEADITDKLKQPSLNIYLPFNLPFSKAKRFFKKEFLKKELVQHQGNISQLAKLLNIDRRSIHRTIKGLGIKLKKLRQKTPEHFQEEFVDTAIRNTLDKYKEILQPQKMEQLYQQIPHLSRNIARLLPREELTWKEAEHEFERQFLEHALEQHRWHITNTAKKLRLQPETLSRKIKKLGLRK